MRNARTVRHWRKCIYFIAIIVFVVTLSYFQWIFLFGDEANDFVPVDVKLAEVTIPSWEPTQNLSTMALYIRPNDDTTLLVGRNVCSNSTPPRVLLMVSSPIENFEYRSAIRNTWANHSTQRYNISVAFITGISEDETIMARVRTENLEHEDMIVENFVESKYNTTLKSTFILKWATRKCKFAKFLMKTVDDAFVNIANLAKYINEPGRGRSKLLVGKLNTNESVVRDSNRNRYMPRYMYPYETYPDYLSESGYLMTMETAQSLYQKALITSFVYLEDVFITGLCAVAAQITRYYDFRFYYVEHGNYKMDCSILYQQKLIVHSYGLEVTTLYNDYQEFKKCLS